MSKKYSIEQFLKTEVIHFNAISHDDEKVLYASDQTGVFNAYEVSSKGGDAKPLTHSTDNAIFPISYFPHDSRLLYSSDQGGNEIHHLFVQDESGKVTDLTPGDNERAVFFDWSQDGKSFFYGSNKRDPRFTDAYEMDIETLTPTLIFQNDEGFEFGSISRDKKYIALNKTINANSMDIYLHNRASGETTLITDHTGDIKYIPHTFNADSTALYFTTDEDDEFMYLKKYNVQTGEASIEQKEAWDITLVKLSPQGNYLMLSINQDASAIVKIKDLTTNKYMNLPDLPEGQLTSVVFSDSEKLISFIYNSSSSPSNLYVYHVSNEMLFQLTDTLNPDIDPNDLVEAQVVRYPSFDGLQVPSIYYEPRVEVGEKVPAVVWVHGGPGGQSTTIYSPLFQYLVNHGYAVLAVNNRGSSGYGKSFFKAADHQHGEVDLEDCIEAKKFLIGTGKVDENKIGIMGGSYGGYMTLAALAFRPDEFKVGVDIFGVANWDRTLKSIPAWWESMRDALYKKIGDPYKEEEYIRSISPLFHAHKITKPLIVLQGANDPRVLKVESDEIVEQVQKNGVPVEYIVFDDEGHGFTKKENQIEGYSGILKFLDTYLK